VTTTELALVPSSAQTWINVKADQARDGGDGRLRLAVFNPNGSPASIGVLLRDANGSAQAAQFGALTVPAGAHTVEWLDELLPLPPTFSSLVTIVSDRPVVTTLHNVRTNFRDTTFKNDPILFVPFVQGDYGVPLDARVQTAVLTPNTTHRLTLANTGFSRLTGNVSFRDVNGAAIQVGLAQGAASSIAYDLQPGAFMPLTFPTPPASGGTLPTMQVVLTPTTGQPAPQLQMQEDQVVGNVQGADTILPRAIPPSTAGLTFRVPIHRERRESGLVFTNTSSFTVTLTARVLGMNGSQQRLDTYTVAPLTQLVVSSDTIAAPLGSSFVGQLSVDSNIPIHAVGYLRLTNERGETIVAGYPALTAATPLASSALAVDGDSWRSEWWFVNRGASLLKSQLDFRGRQAAGMHFPIE
jgi:hypothetical protein